MSRRDVKTQWVSRSDYRGGRQALGHYVDPFGDVAGKPSGNDIDVLPRIFHGCFVFSTT